MIFLGTRFFHHPPPIIPWVLLPWKGLLRLHASWKGVPTQRSETDWSHHTRPIGVICFEKFWGQKHFCPFWIFFRPTARLTQKTVNCFFVWQYEYMNMLKEHGWRKHRMWKACEKNIMDKRRHNYFKGQNWEHLKDLKHIRTNKRLYCWVRIRQSRQDSPWMNSPTLWTLEKKQFEDFDLEQIWTW